MENNIKFKDIKKGCIGNERNHNMYQDKCFFQTVKILFFLKRKR